MAGQNTLRLFATVNARQKVSFTSPENSIVIVSRITSMAAIRNVLIIKPPFNALLVVLVSIAFAQSSHTSRYHSPSCGFESELRVPELVTLHSSRATHCARQCNRSNSCQSFNFNAGTGILHCGIACSGLWVPGGNYKLCMPNCGSLTVTVA